MNKYLLSALLCMTYSVVASSSDIPQHISPALQQAVNRLEKERGLLPDTKTWIARQYHGTLLSELHDLREQRKYLFKILGFRLNNDFTTFPLISFEELISRAEEKSREDVDLAVEYIGRQIEFAIAVAEEEEEEREKEKARRTIFEEQEVKEFLMTQDRAFQARQFEKNRVRALGGIIAGEAWGCSVQ